MQDVTAMIMALDACEFPRVECLRELLKRSCTSDDLKRDAGVWRDL